MIRATITTLLILIVATAIVCGQTSPQKGGSALGNPPAKARERPNPFDNSEPARLAGRKLFLRYCAECHGQTAEGSEHAPSLLGAVRDEMPGTLQWFIKNGDLRAGMPSWPRLPDQQVWQVVAYLKTLAD